MKKILALLLCTLFMTVSAPALAASQVSAPAASETVAYDAVIGGDETLAVLYLTNEERIAKGLDPLCTFDGLKEAAAVRAGELRQTFSHTRPDGRAFHTALSDLSLKRLGAAENIAVGQSDASAVVTAWMNSPGHRKAILTAGYVHLGVGYVPGTSRDTYITHWAQEFLYDECVLTALTVLDADGQAVSAVTLPRNMRLCDAGLMLQLTCSIHGSCTLPLSDSFCAGYAAHSSDAQEVGIEVYGLHANLHVTRGDAVLSRRGTLTNFQNKYTQLSRYTDVKDSDWFSRSVYEAGFLGLMNGTGNHCFTPEGSLRVAEVLTLAARVHDIYYGGDGVFDQSGANWYDAAVAYCLENGILDAIPADLTRAATRAETARWLCAALPASALSPISKRTPGDMAASDADAGAVCTLYAAGVLTGEEDTSYYPSRTLRRCEAAAILVRLTQAHMRVEG